MREGELGQKSRREKKQKIYEVPSDGREAGLTLCLSLVDGIEMGESLVLLGAICWSESRASSDGDPEEPPPLFIGATLASQSHESRAGLAFPHSEAGGARPTQQAHPNNRLNRPHRLFLLPGNLPAV